MVLMAVQRDHFKIIELSCYTVLEAHTCSGRLHTGMCDSCTHTCLHYDQKP